MKWERASGGGWVCTCGDLSWTGRTKAEVRAARDQELQQVLCIGPGLRTPYVRWFPEPMDGVVGGVVVYRTLAARYEIGLLSSRQPGPGAVATHGEYLTLCFAKVALGRWMAQVMYSNSNWGQSGLSMLVEGDGQGQEDHARWVAFQLCYAGFMGDGRDDADLHALACEGQQIMNLDGLLELLQIRDSLDSESERGSLLAVWDDVRPQATLRCENPSCLMDITVPLQPRGHRYMCPVCGGTYVNWRFDR